jgi:hypothetical protein
MEGGALTTIAFRSSRLIFVDDLNKLPLSCILHTVTVQPKCAFVGHPSFLHPSSLLSFFRSFVLSFFRFLCWSRMNYACASIKQAPLSRQGAQRTCFLTASNGIPSFSVVFSTETITKGAIEATTRIRTTTTTITTKGTARMAKMVKAARTARTAAATTRATARATQ